MARGKKVKTGGKARGTPRRGQSSNGPSPRASGSRHHDDDRGNAPFMLRDAARAEHGSAFWSSPLNLRNRSIGFVKSSEPDPQIEPEIGSEPEHQALEDSDGVGSDIPALAIQETADFMTLTPPPEADTSRIIPGISILSKPISDVPGQAPFVGDSPPPSSRLIPGLSTMSRPMSDITGQDTLLDASPPPRSPSPALSNSSEEVVLFKGRAGQKCATSEKKDSTTILSEHASFSVPKAQMLLPASPILNVAQSIMPSQLIQADNDREREAQVLSRPPKFNEPAPKSADFISFSIPRKGSRKKGHKTREQAMDMDDGVLDDYLANMRENGELDFSKLEEGMDENAEQEDLDGWASSDIRDFDELSTSNEVLDVVPHVIAKRQRPSGLQYLVVWDGYTIDDARWIHHTSLTMDGAAAMIEVFEEAEMKAAALTPASDDSVDEEDDEDLEDTDEDDDDEDEDFDDDRDLIERRAARLSDEKLARLLAKQEDLGLGSEELVLFDEMFADEGEGDGDSDIELRMALAASRKKRKPRSKRSNLFADFDDDDDEMIGDDYGDFDIMDRDRPSIGRGSKMKSDPLTWGLSDSDQAEELRNVWVADRRKKKEKKQEREELRAQGLLGKKNKFKPDLNARYNEGMDIDQLSRELQEFLFSTNESLALPPMEKRDRKTVHEIASVFGLKSLSKGSGRARFPVLQKTSKTIEFDEYLFQRVRSRVGRKFYPRMDRGKGGAGAAHRGRGGGPGGSGGILRADTGYRAGEVVGGTAPELGADNRGRAMLEKMGWTSGNALGALNNKGILQPIAHVIRNSRAGLG